MSDKKKKKDKEKGPSVEFDGTFAPQELSRRLIELGERIGSGAFSVSIGKESLALRMNGPVQLNLRARASERVQSLRLELDWEARMPEVEPKLEFGAAPELELPGDLDAEETVALAEEEPASTLTRGRRATKKKRSRGR